MWDSTTVAIWNKKEESPEIIDLEIQFRRKPLVLSFWVSSDQVPMRSLQLSHSCNSQMMADNIHNFAKDVDL